MKKTSIVIATAAALTATVGGVAEAGARRAGEIPGSYIVVLRDGADARGTEQQLSRDHGVRGSMRFTRALKGFAATLSGKQLDQVRRHPAVAFVTQDRPIRATSTPLSPGDAPPSGVRRVEAVSGTYAHGAAAPVAVIDSGIDLDHPDLTVAEGVDCIASGNPDDANGHGTHVAGTIGALNDGRGAVGVAPGTRLHPVRVLDAEGRGSWASIICGIDWVTARMTDADTTNDIRVANMSLGGPGPSVRSCATTTDALHLAICRSTAAGVTYVVAAGNSGWDFDYAPVPDLPAAYPEVLTVSAAADTDGAPGGLAGAPVCDPNQRDDRAATFSNFAATSGGAAHLIAAPGSCITSTWPGGGTETISGTSMASPHVAAAAALCIREGEQDGPCAGSAPAQVIAKLRADASRRTSVESGFGFVGDPTRPYSGRSYGYLAWAGVDRTAPTVTSRSPAADAVGVASGEPVTAAFSESMDRSATQSAFRLVRDGATTPVTGTFGWSGTTMTFRSSAALAQGSWYTATIANSASDLAGNKLEQATTWRFKTLLTTTVSAA
ncbi:MAG TPA: S8 family serine peptidase, partial [Actinomycetota bacterium]|nr:S8 family serine peptidase [Actinomycetota bacterium]